MIVRYNKKMGVPNVRCFLGSFLFNIYFFCYLGFISLVYKFIPKDKGAAALRRWCCALGKVLKFLCNIDYQIINPEKKPNVPVIYAVRHESTWETFMLFHILYPVVFVLKKELLAIPLFGSMMKSLKMISVDRSSPLNALKVLIKGFKKVLAENKSLVIFPEGTRCKPGIVGDISSGIYGIYSDSSIQVIPVFLNSGLVWPRKSFFKYPGMINIEFLDPIEPGLSKEEFLNKLKTSFKSKIELYYEANNS